MMTTATELSIRSSSQPVSSTGPAKNSTATSASAVSPMPITAMGLISFSSSPRATLEEKISERMPRDRVSPSTMTPRTKGMRLGPLYTSPRASRRTAMSPSGRRQATATLRGPRIITPSMTAWPP